jgi:hypothetical protein
MDLSAGGIVLEFSEHVEELTGGLSAAAFVGEDLWLACDELASVERLSPSGRGFGRHRSFELHGALTLPAHGLKKVDQEIDIEGLDFDGRYLWLVGSHSVKRKRLDRRKHGADSDEEKIDRLRKIESEGNRYLLARVPVVQDGETGESVIAKSSADGALTAAQLPCTLAGNALTRAVLEEDEGGRHDRHLAPWLQLPGKDNGFDIEGLAAANGRVFLGLRSPVLRGWAVVLELSLEDAGEGELGLKRIGPGGRAYRRHFLDLGGLGLRSLAAAGDDLLVLAGPPMTHDGPVRVFRWRGGGRAGAESVVWAEDLGRPVLSVPHGEGVDRAEGMALLPGAAPPAVLVVYDAPAEARKVSDRAVRADVFRLD